MSEVQLGPRSDPEEVLAAFVQSSRKLPQQILSRARIYLFLGVIIAFAGVFWFSLQPPDPAPRAPNFFGDVLRHAPRFGVLFFIEFIAIFFLRQYRSDMEEFRYYEAIQRKREDAFLLVRFMKEQDQKVDIARLVDICIHSSGVDKLAAGESTELLEAKKLTKDETDVL